MGRLGSAKSSSGCITCKIRRVKCDESRPACYRCVKTGRKCDGYAAPLRRTIPICGNRTHAQFQAFDYFVDQILPGMTRVVDTKFWDRFLLQASHADSVVWLATTSMSELIRQLQSGNANRQLALQWYTESIHKLQAQIKHEMRWSVACSITAIIYMCIECLLDNMSGVVLIYQQAMQQIGQARNDEVDGAIAPLLRHITVAHGLPLLSRSTSAQFSSTADAQEVLYVLISEAHQFIESIEIERLAQPKHWQPPTDLINQRDHFLARLQTWQHATTSQPVLSLEEAKHPLVWSCMHLAHANYTIWTSAILDTEMAFDAHIPQFEAMLANAETAIAAMSSGLPSLFSFETRVIPFLGFIATRCRHPLVRRRALQVLLTGPQIENTRTAAATIVSAKRIIAIEESGSGGGEYCDVPESLEMPAECDRLVSAKIEHQIGKGGHVEQFLKFGRWRLCDGEWVVKFETVKV